MSRNRSSRKSRAGRSSSRNLQIVCPDAAGIDLGSREHFVCLPPRGDGEPEVCCFATDTRSLHELADRLSEAGVTDVAMESTGVYWIPLYDLLVSRGFEVVLVDTRSLARVPGRKTDVQDCQWIRQLHAYGLLRGAFRPGEDTVRFRTLARMSKTLTDQRADWLRRMQKELDQMNVCVHHAVSDLSGATGMAIVHAIVDGERDPAVLARLRDPRCSKSVAQIERELTGTWREEHLILLEVALRTYEFLGQQLEQVRARIDALLQRYRVRDGREAMQAPQMLSPGKAAATRKRGQDPMRHALYAFSGVDLTRIPGINVRVAEVILSEIGPDLGRFPTEKQFVSWLRLAPDVALSAGRRVKGKRRPRNGCSRAREALRMAAVAASHTRTALGAYYRGISVRKGGNAAVFATARKIAQYVYRMLRFGAECVDRGLEHYEQQCVERRMQRLRNTARALGCQVVPNPAETVA